MAIVNFTKLGAAVGDHEAERTVMRLVRMDADQTYDTSSLAVIRAIQTLVSEGKVPGDKFKIMYEGEPVVMDCFGRLKSPPPSWVDVRDLLQGRFRLAVGRRIYDLLDEKQKKQLRESYASWVKETVVELFTTPSFTEEGQPVGESTGFVIAPEHAEDQHIDNVEEREKYSALQWGTTEQGVVVLMTDRGIAFPVDTLVAAAFDLQGDKIIARPFNTRAALDAMGLDGKTITASSWVS